MKRTSQNKSWKISLSTGSATSKYERNIVFVVFFAWQMYRYITAQLYHVPMPVHKIQCRSTRTQNYWSLVKECSKLGVGTLLRASFLGSPLHPNKRKEMETLVLNHMWYCGTTPMYVLYSIQWYIPIIIWILSMIQSNLLVTNSIPGIYLESNSM